jgi:Snf7
MSTFFSAIFGKPATAAKGGSSSGATSAGGAPAYHKPAAAPLVRVATSEAKAQIQETAETVETLEKKVTLLDAEIEEIKLKAKAKLDKGDKNSALMLIKRAKLKEATRDQVNASINKLLQVRDAIDSQVINATITNSLAKGADVLAKTSIAPEKADEVMDALDEQMSNLQATTDALNREIVSGVEVGDDDELLAEIEGFGAVSPQTTTPAAAVQPQKPQISLPTAPQGPISAPVPKSAEDDEAMLAELRAQMS